MGLPLYAALLFLATRLPLFDSSPALLPDSSPFVRWDVFHFLHIAHHGYVYEHEWAFFPALPFVLSLVRPSVFLAALLSALAFDSYRTLYALSLYHLRSKELAKLASLLSLIPTSPVTLYFAPCNEPFFTYLSYRGMLYCTREQWLQASLAFALAGAFRSNGFFLGGFVLWGLLVRPFLDGKMPTIRAFLKTIFFEAIIVSPFVMYHIYTYAIFCLDSAVTPPAWCNRVFPSIYSYVQSKYWNVGFLRYWTPAQLPNFLIATPTIFLICAYSFHHLKKSPAFAQTTLGQAGIEPHFVNPSITPHILHALIFTSILLFASHTQIILRLAASMPVSYWAAAWLLLEHPSWGRLWVTWSLLWSMVSTVLWTAFLPPA